jgi:hypothetical protein
MIFIVQEREVNLDITTITLATSVKDINNDQLNLLHCIWCGSALTQITGNVAKISFGEPPVRRPAQIVLCRNCKRKYIFE